MTRQKAVKPKRGWIRALMVAGGGVVAALGLVIGYQFHIDPASDSATRPPVNTNAAIERGALLARAGNCMGCHTERGSQPYAGGRAIVTPFGEVFASNITPDPETGIGRWSANDFWRALHHGQSRDGRLLYPAFPYTEYTKVTREDADALFAYLLTVPPATQTNRAHRLAFPYNQQPVLALWRALYFRPGEYQRDATHSDEWNRGAYLVQGLGHCAACHTPRNALGGSITARPLAGGVIPALNWHAPALTGDSDALGAWSTTEIVALLGTGVSARGSTFGPMAEVVASSLQHLPTQDLQAMAVYLKSLPATGDAKIAQTPSASPEDKAVLSHGAKLYEQHCVNCHGEKGLGAPPAYPALANHASMTSDSALNAIRMVLNGGFPPGTKGNPRPYGMPPFGTALADDEVAAVVSFIRSEWGRQPALVSVNAVRRARGMAGD